MRFKERNDLANRCKEWMKDQLENNITTPLDTVHMVLAYLDVNGYLNEVVRCKDCKYHGATIEEQPTPSIMCAHMHDNDYCSYGERREDGKIH